MSRMVVPGGATPFITNNNSPNGGVVKLISSDKSMMRPNQIGSKPSVSASGKKIGTVKSMMEINSYHDNIVNLQGITYKAVRRMVGDVVNGLATIDVSFSKI